MHNRHASRFYRKNIPKTGSLKKGTGIILPLFLILSSAIIFVVNNPGMESFSDNTIYGTYGTDISQNSEDNDGAAKSLGASLQELMDRAAFSGDLNDTIVGLIVVLDANAQGGVEHFIKHISSSDKNDMDISENHPYISVKKVFRSFSTVYLQTELKNVPNLLKIDGVRGIYLDEKTPVNRGNLDKESTPQPRSASASESTWCDYKKMIGLEDLSESMNINGELNGSKAVIAILDSGIDITGQIGRDLDDFDDNSSTADAKFYGAVSFVSYEPFYYSDTRGSGTYHAGIAVGTGSMNSSFRGVAPGAYYLNVKVLDSLGFTYPSFVLSGLEWAFTHDADIILLPWSFPGMFNDPISNAINILTERGIIVVAASGDEGGSYTSMETPAQALGAITVGAYDHIAGGTAVFSSRGPTYDLRVGPDIIAPGVNIVGPRVRVTPAENSSSQLLEGILGNSSEGRVEGIKMPELNISYNQYGIPLDENYTMTSSSSAAAAIVAGVCAIMVSLFPDATPEMIKVALLKTSSIVNGGQNEEGSGIINVTAACLFLSQYLNPGDTSFSARIPQALLYPGAIINADFKNITHSKTNSTPSNWDPSNIFSFTSSQALTSMIIITNDTTSGENNSMNTDVHLPLNQFAIEFNGTSYPFSDLIVEREISNITSISGYDATGYARYASILSWNSELFITIIIESWPYRYDGFLTPLHLQPNITGRITALRYTFYITDFSSTQFENIWIHAFFKADLYLNEYNPENSMDLSKTVEAAYDDEIFYNSSSNLIYFTDCFNFSGNENRTNEYTSMAFTSITHNLGSWEINSTDNLFYRFMKKDFTASNSSEFDKMPVDNGDPGYFESWKIADKLTEGGILNFSGVFGIGVGENRSHSLDRLYDAIERCTSNVSIPGITDMAIITMNTSRMLQLGKKMYSDCYIINLGNTPINNTELWFIANRSSSQDSTELFNVIYPVKNWQPMQIKKFSISWIPGDQGIYTIGWLIGGYTILFHPDDSYYNNYMSRNAVIFDFSALLDMPNAFNDLVYITPYRFPDNPFIVKFPGDFAAVNFTIISPLELPDVVPGLSSSSAINVDFPYNEPFGGNHYRIISMIMSVPLFYQKGISIFNVIFRFSDGSIKYVPIQYKLEESIGRLMFDGIHNRFIPELDGGLEDFNFTTGGFSLDFFLKERLDTIIGNYFNFRRSLSILEPKGMSMIQLMKGLSAANGSGDEGNNLLSGGLFGDTDSMITSVGDSGQMNNSFAVKNMFKGDNFFKFEDNITTERYSYDLIKFFDGLIFVDPEIPLDDGEFSAVERYIRLGGVLFIFTENRTENDIPTMNRLANLGGLNISQTSTPGLINITVNNADFWQNPQNYNITLKDPVEISVLNESRACFLDKSSNNSHFMGLGTYYKGKIVVVGDSDFINEDFIDCADNKIAIKSIFTNALNNRLQFEVKISNTTIRYGESSYISINLQNKEMFESTRSDFLAMTGFVNGSGVRINASLYGFEFPAFPFLRTNDSAFYVYFDSKWVDVPPNYFIEGRNYSVNCVIYIDTPDTVSLVYSFEIIIEGIKTESNTGEYSPPELSYPNEFDIIFISVLLIQLFIIWKYSALKWRSRHRYVPMTSENRNMINNKLNSTKIIFMNIIEALTSRNLDELERLRIILQNKEIISENIREIRELGSKLGEI